jgi:hypothetical protein
MRRFTALGRFFLAESSGPAALRRGLPLYLAIGICATIIFGGSGAMSLDASTFVRIAEQTALARLLLLALWVTATLPVARAIVTAEATAFLRTLPIPPWHVLSWMAALMFLAEAPWFVLFTRGGGIVSGLGATLIALACHACLLARLRTVFDAALFALATGAWIATPAWSRIAVGATVFPVALSRAWRRGAEHAAARVRGRIVGSPVRALATAYGLTLVRRHASALLRAVFVTAIGVGWLALAMRNEDTRAAGSIAPPRLVLASWIPICVFCTATLTGPVLRAEAGAEWVLSVCGTKARLRRAAAVSILTAAGGVLGLLSGALLGLAGETGNGPAYLVLVAALAIGGAAMAAVTEAAVRWSTRNAGRDGGRVVLSLVAVIGLAEGALWLVESSARPR